MAIDVIITFTARENRLVAFNDLLAQVSAELPQIEGCEGVQIFSNVDDPRVFTLVESWTSQRAHEKHVTQLVASGAWARIASHLACEPTSGYFQRIRV